MKDSTPKTKKQLLDEFADACSQLEWLEYTHIPYLIVKLKEFKLTKKDIENYNLEEYL